MQERDRSPWICSSCLRKAVVELCSRERRGRRAQGPSHVLPNSPEHEVIHCCIFAMFPMKLDFSKHFLALVPPGLVLQAAL